MQLQDRVNSFTSQNPNYEIQITSVETEDTYAISQAVVTIFNTLEDGKSIISRKVSARAKALQENDDDFYFIERSEDKALNRALNLLSI